MSRDIIQEHEAKQKKFETINTEDSNDEILQYTLNVPKDSKKRQKGGAKQEQTRFANEWIIRDVALDFRILRKKKVFYTICLQFLKHAEYLWASDVDPDHYFMDTFNNWGIEDRLFEGITKPPLLRWFSNLMTHMMSVTQRAENQSLRSTIGDPELNSLVGQSAVMIKKEILEFESNHVRDRFPEAISGLQRDVDYDVDDPLYTFGIIHLIKNSINFAALNFAQMHNLTFAPFTSAYKKRGLMSFSGMASSGVGGLDRIVESHNQTVTGQSPKDYKKVTRKKRGKKANDDAHAETITRTASTSNKPFAPNTDPSLVTFSPVTPEGDIIDSTLEAIYGDPNHKASNIPLDVLFEAEGFLGQEAEVGGAEREGKGEEGWEALAREVLPKNGLDPANYGLQTPSTPPLIYEQLAVQEHDHPPIDANDFADATEAAIQFLMDERRDAENMGGGEFMMAPSLFAGELLGHVVPSMVTPYNWIEADDLFAPLTPNAGLPDEFADTPPRSETPALVLPPIADILPGTESPSTPALHISTPPSTARVHSDPAHCSKVAERFIEAWRTAKKKLYRQYGIRHFNINRALFRSGAVCHRCYQLVRQHHETYHLHNGRIAIRKVLNYPRHRRKGAHERISENRHTRKYIETRKKAKKYTKHLVNKNASQLRRYNKKLLK